MGDARDEHDKEREKCHPGHRDVEVHDARGVALDAVGLRDEEHAVCGHREEQEAAQAEDAGEHRATKSIAHVGAREGIGTLTLAWPRSPRSPWCRADLV